MLKPRSMTREHAVRPCALAMAVLLLALQPLAAQIITTIAGTGAFGTPGCGTYSGDGGPALEAELSEPFCILFDANDNILFTDGVNNRIRMIDTEGIITTIAGDSTRGYNGDGIPATSAWLAPFGITLDHDGNLIIADGGNNRIRRVDKDTGIITTIAGTGVQGFSGDGGPATAATFFRPSNLAYDAEGNLFIADWYNNRIRRIDTQGIITTVAGSGVTGQNIGGFGGDGGLATDAQLFNPISLAFAPDGDLYITDFHNNRIRKVDAQGIITTVAGNGASDFNGDFIPAATAHLNRPSGIAFDANGNLIFSDEVHLRIRLIDPSGIISTIAGNGVQGYAGDNGPAILAEINDAVGITFDPDGNMIFCDELNNRIRKVTDYATGIAPLPAIAQATLEPYPNPSSGTFAIDAGTGGTVSVLDVHGAVVMQVPAHGLTQVDAGGLRDGVYLVRLDGPGRPPATGRLVVVH